MYKTNTSMNPGFTCF